MRSRISRWLKAAAELRDTWGCVYPGCGASFDSYVALQAHMGEHYR
ncbi:hypothetical protein [Streptomyces chartreusis]